MNLFFCFCLAFSRDSWVGEDKLKHLVTSFAVTTVTASIARGLGADAGTAAWTGAGTAAALGIGKEVYDARTPGNAASFRDLAWDGAGIAAGTMVMMQMR